MVRPMSTRPTPIRRVAVLGAGVMGSGIAAHCANAGIPVVLLDIVPPNAMRKGEAKRNAFAARRAREAQEGQARGVHRTRATRS